VTNGRLKILVVDDNRSGADALARLLRKTGDEVQAVYDGQTAIDRLQSEPPDIVLTDLKMEPVDGMAVLDAARRVRPPIETIVFTAYGAIDVAVRAMHMGARDFLTKPVTVEQVNVRLDQLRAERGDEGRTDEDVGTGAPDGFVARAEASRQLLAMLERAAGVPSSVWIEGELGSGRSYVARTLHWLGDQLRGSETPFAVRQPQSHEPWPDSGTVLLPNIDDLPVDAQTTLHQELRAVPERVRVRATALPEGRHRISEGALRPELYYRLAVVVVPVPPLRHRHEDIARLFKASLESNAARFGRPVPEMTPRMRDLLERHYWPGNLRELFNLAERTVVLGAEGFNLEVIDPPSAGVPKLESGFSLSSHLEEVERRILVEALRRAGGDRTEAGRLLGVERNTLRYKLNKYGLLDR